MQDGRRTIIDHCAGCVHYLKLTTDNLCFTCLGDKDSARRPNYERIVTDDNSYNRDKSTRDGKKS